jgi:hypothetical protein
MPRSRPSSKKGQRIQDPPRIFLLSPAFVGGERAKLLLNPLADFDRARKFRSEGLPLSDVFSFASGLYFRGKIAYANRFARAERGDVVRVITSNRGLMDPGTIVGPAELLAFGTTDIDDADSLYHEPLRRDAAPFAENVAILLGSIATPKYRRVLLEVFGSRLLFPGDFVGRGDMSRGALLLRATQAGKELAYLKVNEAVLTGRRAPKVSDGR